MEQPNELMTWEKMKQRYPSKWVIVERTEGTVTNIKAGIVRFVANDDEIDDIWVKCHRAGFDYDKKRTKMEPFSGIVDGIDFSIDAKAIYK